jgi:hypothetical protein
MKINDFKNELEAVTRDLYFSQRASGDGSGLQKDASICIRIGQKCHKFCLSHDSNGKIILSIQDELDD